MKKIKMVLTFVRSDMVGLLCVYIPGECDCISRVFRGCS